MIMAKMPLRRERTNMLMGMIAPMLMVVRRVTATSTTMVTVTTLAILVIKDERTIMVMIMAKDIVMVIVIVMATHTATLMDTLMVMVTAIPMDTVHTNTNMVDTAIQIKIHLLMPPKE